MLFVLRARFADVSVTSAAVQSEHERAGSAHQAARNAVSEQQTARSSDIQRAHTGQTVAGLAGREPPISDVTTQGRAHDLWKTPKSGPRSLRRAESAESWEIALSILSNVFTSRD